MASAMSGLSDLTIRAWEYTRSRSSTRWVIAGRTVFFLAVLAWLAYKLSGIGWRDVWDSRPRTPWFYVIWLGLYFQLPVVEALIYRVLWNLPLRQSLLPLLHKRTLNQDVVSGFGEAFFFLWARHCQGFSDGQIAGTLKDSVIASSFASWTSIGLLVLITGRILPTAFLAVSDPLYVVTGLVLIVALLALGVRLRRRLLTLSPNTVLRLFLVHFGRFVLLVYLLQVLQWWVVLPDVPLSLWVTMLVVVTVINRMPFMPARDLVGIGAILGMLALPAAFEATIAAMLLMRSVLDKTCNLALSIATVVLDWKGRLPIDRPTR